MSKPKAPQPKVSDELSGLHFLVVDDDVAARHILVDYLKGFGYKKISEAVDGADALKILASQKVDFVISDWEMPGKNGLELLRALKTEDKFKSIPFIMVTSPGSQERFKVEDAATSSVDGYIIKPFRSQVLREKIDHALAEKSFREKKAALVVDDDDEVRSTIVAYLRQMGYSPIYEAKDGDEGFGALQLHHNEIAFVVSDWEMPRLAGIDLLRRIRNDPEMGLTPFIMVTSQTSIERLKLKKAMDSDVDHYLLKPFKGDDLRKKVEWVLRNAKTQIEVERELKVAEGHLSSGVYGEAEKAYQNVLITDSTCVRAYLGLATVQIRLAPQKGLEKAIGYIRRAIAINPQYVDAHIELANAFENAMSLEKAINVLKDAKKHCSLSEDIHYHLGRLYLRRGREAEAIVELQKALDLNPNCKGAAELLTAELWAKIKGSSS